MSEHPKIELNTGEDSGAAPQPPVEAEAISRPTFPDWQAAAATELKGKDVTWHTAEGIAVKPLYTAQDIAEHVRTLSLRPRVFPQPDVRA